MQLGFYVNLARDLRSFEMTVAATADENLKWKTDLIQSGNVAFGKNVCELNATNLEVRRV